MKKIAVIGSTNVDLITYANRFAKDGETLEAESFCICNGCKGANQAVAAARLGSHVLMLSNETELEISTGKSVSTIEEIKQAASVLFEHGLKNLMVIMGSQGSLWISKQYELLTGPVKVNAIDTSDASDAFFSCFSHFFTEIGGVQLAIEKARHLLHFR